MLRNFDLFNLHHVVLFQWEPERLKAETQFVMGARANKSVPIQCALCFTTLYLDHFDY